MKIKMIAEIGLNHLGKESYLDQYLSILKKKKNPWCFYPNTKK